MFLNNSYNIVSVMFVTMFVVMLFVIMLFVNVSVDMMFVNMFFWGEVSDILFVNMSVDVLFVNKSVVMFMEQEDLKPGDGWAEPPLHPPPLPLSLPPGGRAPAAVCGGGETM